VSRHQCTLSTVKPKHEPAVLATTHPWSGPRHSCTPAGFWQTARLHSVHCPISYPVDASRYLVGMWLDLTTSHRQTWFISSTSTCHSTDLLTARGVAHLVVHGTSGSTSYETIPHVRVVLSTVDMVVLRDHDDDDGEIAGVHGTANAAGAGAVPWSHKSATPRCIGSRRRQKPATLYRPSAERTMHFSLFCVLTNPSRIIQPANTEDKFAPSDNCPPYLMLTP